jgi:hypothetical protein
MNTYESGVIYMDSRSANWKDCTKIKGVLDKAFNGFIAKADHPITKQKKHEAASRSSTKPSSAATSRLCQIVGWRPGTPSFI